MKLRGVDLLEGVIEKKETKERNFRTNDEIKGGMEHNHQRCGYESLLISGLS